MKIIPNSVKNFVSNPKTAEFVENTIIAVGTETTLKMIGRPTFIFLDTQADEKKKKFAAVKEFLYQATCLGLYFTIVPVVKELSYLGLSKILRKKQENKILIDEFNKEADIVKAAKNEYKKTGSFIERNFTKKQDKIIKATKELWVNAHKTFKENISSNPKLHLGKGCHELGAIVGSVLTLAIIAPEISHFIVHPLMRALKLEKPDNKH